MSLSRAERIPAYRRCAGSPWRPRPVAREDRKVPCKGRRRQQGLEGGQRIADGLGGALRPAFRRPALAGWRAQIDERAAAHGALSRGVADHITIRNRRGDRPVEHQLNIGGLARQNRLVAKQHDMCSDLGRGMVQPRRKPLPHRSGLARQQAQPGVDAVGRCMQFGINHHIAAVNGFLRNALARQIERATVSRPAGIRGLVLDMQANGPAPTGPTG